MLELERGLREGAEKQLADLARMQQEQGVGVPPAVPANVPAHTCEPPPFPPVDPPPVSARAAG